MSTNKNLKNYSSSIPPMKSIGQIMTTLGSFNATNVGIEMEKGLPVGLTFNLKLTNRELSFLLPARVSNVYDLLQTCKAGKHRTWDQAQRTAWKNIHDWIVAQLALIESEQTQVAEIFLPFLIMPGGGTAFEALAQGNSNQFHRLLE